MGRGLIIFFITGFYEETGRWGFFSFLFFPFYDTFSLFFFGISVSALPFEVFSSFFSVLAVLLNVGTLVMEFFFSSLPFFVN